jgi:glyoxylase-like metal-dependent hydrolase (beta-lactamase superfamily II)
MMKTEFGPITYLPGKNGGRFPYDNALFIDDDIKAVIDPGSDLEQLKKLNAANDIELVFDSHYHYDHMRFNYIFKNSRILLHELDAPLFDSLDKLAEAIGIPFLHDQQTVEQWKKQLSGGPAYFRGMYDVAYGPEWIWSTERVDGTYKNEDMFEFGEVKMEVLHAPGHSTGMCCFVFPKQEAAYVTDYDLTPFGPWYGSRHCNMDDIITSAEKLKALSGIKWYITSHEMGVFERNEFLEGLHRFLEIIDERDEKIIDILRSGARTMDELVRSSIVYKAKHVEDKFTHLWEWNHVEKHLERMLSREIIEVDGGKYKLI